MTGQRKVTQYGLIVPTDSTLPMSLKAGDNMCGTRVCVYWGWREATLSLLGDRDY